MLSFFSKRWDQIQAWLKDTALHSVRDKSDQKPNFTHLSAQHILCVDDDPDFCLYLQKLAKPFHIILDEAHTVADAKSKIMQFPYYRAFIIDGHLPDGSGFELLNWIREKKELNVPISFLSRIYNDATSFRLLKETLNVDYVLEKPIQPSEVENLFKNLLERPLSSDINTPLLDVYLVEIKKNYQKTIYDKVERLEKLILKVQKNPSLENLQHLKAEVHKIGGSSGSYGYPAVSEVCKKLEEELFETISKMPGESPKQAWLNSLENFFTQIKLNYQLPSNLEPAEEENLPVSFQTPSVYIAESDHQLMEYIEKNKKELLLLIQIETDVEKARALIKSPDFNPQAIFLCSQYQDPFLNGYDLLSEYYSIEKTLSPDFGLMTQAENGLEEQINALKRGIDINLSKSLGSKKIFELLQITFNTKLFKETKVLVVDEDIDVCIFICQALKEIGLDCHFIQDKSKIADFFANEPPDLLLLDLNFPGFQGTQIVELIRNQLGYKGLLIAMATVTQEASLIEQIYGTQINDILFKPPDKKILHKRILNLLQKNDQSLARIHVNNFPIVCDLNVFEEFVQKKRASTTPKGYVSAIAIIDRQALSVKEVKDKSFSESFIQLLKSEFRKSQRIVELSEGKWAFFFEGLDLNYLAMIVEEFFKLMSIRFKPSKSFDFRGGVAQLPLQITTTYQIWEGAERALKFAKERPQECAIVLNEAQQNFTATKEIIVMANKDEVIHQLAAIFQPHDFIFKVVKTSKEALNTLLGRESFNPLPLVIVDFQALDQELKQFCQELRRHDEFHLPVMVVSSVEEIKEIFMNSNLSYFEKPFSLMIIIQERD